MDFVEALIDYVFQKPPPDEIHESIGWGRDAMFTSEELASCRSEDGSWNFKIKLVASTFADEVSFSPSINFKLTLQDLNFRIKETFSGSREIKKQLKKPTNNLKNSWSAHISEIYSVFEDGGTTICRDGVFDWEGDDDILKINFGGRNVDIKRSDLTKPVIGWNLFSCLFEKKWDRYHVCDRNGRFYVDLKEDWVRPLIEYFKYNESAKNHIDSVDFFLRCTIKIFTFDKKFLLYDLIPRISWIDLESSQLFSEMKTVNTSAMHRSQRTSIRLFPYPTYFKLIYSNSKPIIRFPLEADIRFKPIFCLYKATDGKMFVIFLTWAQRPSVRYDDSVGIAIATATRFNVNKCERQINIVSDLFPIQFIVGGIEYSINNPPVENETLELYEVNSSIYSVAIPKSPFTIEATPPSENRVIASNPSPLFLFQVQVFIRSTILRVIPKSQLAVRVSGRWEEQPSKGDIDEEGNLIVNCHKESFKQILSALQICRLSRNHLSIARITSKKRSITSKLFRI
jgi:hypothetical protein